MKTKFVFLLLPEIHLMDLAGPDQAIHEAIEFGADFEIEYCNLVNNVSSTSGLPIGNVKHFSEIKINKGDFLIIPGSNASYLQSEKFKKNIDLLNWIKTIYQNGTNVCSICAGAFALAESGLLDNVSCTTHFKRTKQLQELYPKSKVVENILFTDSNRIYTSAGIASGIDLTLYIIEKLKGSHFAHLVARELVVYNRRNGDSSQESELLKFRNHIHSGIHKAQDWIIENIHIKNSLNELAEIANMSERNFTRVFKKETSITVNDFITLIRKEKISNLLKNPNLSRAEIASKIGLKNERQLNRIINKKKRIMKPLKKLLLLLSISISISLFGQNKKENTMTTKTNNQLEIKPSATSSEKDFDFLEGKWKVHNRMLKERLNNSNVWNEFESELHLHKTLNGLGNVENYYATFNDKPFEGMAVRLFNPKTRLWKVYWMDSNNGTMDENPVTGSFENGLGKFYANDIFNEIPILVLYQWDATNPLQPIWSQAFSKDNGKTWEWNWEMTLTKIN